MRSRWMAWAILSLGVTVSGFDSAFHPCPAACDGKPVTNWTVYTSLDRLHVCRQPMLLDFAIHNALDDPSTTVKLLTCTAGDANDRRNALVTSDHSHTRRSASAHGRTERGSSTCVSGKESKVSLELDMSADDGSAEASALDAALEKAQRYIGDTSNCDTTSTFGYVRGAVVGVYSGAAIDNSATAPSLIQRARDQIKNGQSPKSIVMQLCGDGRNADHTFGLAVDMTGDLAAVQKSVRSWSHARCVNGTGVSTHLSGVTILEKPLVPSNSTMQVHNPLRKRGDCRTITVVSGDSCGSLASKCGISGADFTKYNPAPDLCSTLAVGERVCCTSGTLPDITPKENPDGSCASYTVQSGDTCSAIAAANGLKASDISDFNDKTTWGWFGCDDLQLGLNICLSKGTPPMPAPVSNAVCGPTVPGTSKPKDGESLADLNPCPLNACCDIWGQCGITPDYCTADEGPTGNPGTAPTGKNGCISNCGTNITNNDDAPSSFMSVGYYESWNFDRPCLNLRAASIGVIGYTHVHWAFATINSDFSVVINDTYNQFNDFMALDGVRKIVSFGGWGYSTDPATYEMLRSAMDPANVDTFVSNIVDFVEKKGLDGVDIDWEYPGAPDIPGIPPGLASDGPNYLAFLKALRAKLPSNMTLSMAAPASYWYLKAFPIHNMSSYVDYIVYMTYDLHGQWDYGNQWSQSGCPSGNCLLSHVNLTETEYALAMLTKAGVKANMIAVGVSSYGRSFGMTEAGCDDPSCTFTGPDSGAQPGTCTGTAGILGNAEIDNIIGLNETTSSYYDSSSDSNILVYNDTQWVAYMDGDVKASRIKRYKDLNFAGSVDWAIDLAEWTGDDGNPNGTSELPPTTPLSECSATFDSLEDLGNSADSIPLHCATQYTMATLSNLLTVAMNNYTDMVNNGYDSKFKTYAKAVADSAGSTVHNFVYENGNKYFSCIVAETTTCCDYCSGSNYNGNQCLYCFDGDCYKKCSVVVCGHGISTLPNTKIANESEPCPPDYSKRGYGPDNPYEQTVYWTLEDGKADNFWSDLLDNTGIPKDKITFGSYDRGNDCAPSNSEGDGDPCWATGMDFNIPKPNGYSESDVANPKDVVEKGLSNSADLGPQIKNTLFGMSVDAWIGDGFELIDSVSLPILMIADAVENMAKVVEIADKITEEERKEIILAFIGAILFFVPIAGEVLGSVAELSDIASIITIAGGAGNAAMDVYTIVDDPANAPLAIMSLIFAPAALADVATIAKAAKIRRAMTDEDIVKLGGKVADRMGFIKKITGPCNK